MEIDYSKVPQVTLSYVDEVCNDRAKVSTSRDAVELFRPYFKQCMQHHEEMWVMYLNTSGKVLGVLLAGSGTVSATLANIKAIAQGGILSNASKVIMAHNHPSGGLQPSYADKKLTEKLRMMFELLEIALVDHVIITYEGYMSFLDEGYL